MNSTCTPPREVDTLPLWSSVRPVAVAGPMGLVDGAKIEMISPGAKVPLAPLAALITLLTVGSGAVTLSVTLMVDVPVVLPLPLTVIVPLYVPAFRLPGVTVTERLAGLVPLVGETASQLPVLLAEAVKLPVPDTCKLPGDGVWPPAW